MTSHKTLAVIFGLLFISTLTFAHADDWRCGHDDQVYEIEKQDIEEDMSALNAGRVLASTAYPNMRTATSYKLLSNGPSAFANYVKNELAPPVMDWLSGALRVKYPVAGLLKVSSSSLCGVSTPSELRAGVNADYFYILDSFTEDSTTVASSRACTQASGTNRPLTAYTKINRNMLAIANGNVIIHEKNMYLLIHEIFHTLAISNNLYSEYIDGNAKTMKGHIMTKTYGGVSQQVINIPALTQKLRTFYGCNNLDGIILENDGGSGTAGSHFERKFFPYEVISSGGIFGRRVSEFSLALLEGSGWYAPDYNYAEPYFFGQGQGCNFINTKCSSSKSVFSEFCTGSSRGCAPQGRSGGTCSTDSKANGCRYIDPNEDYDCDNEDGADYARFPTLEAYGRSKNAKCFTGTLNSRKSSNGGTSFCFKYNCVGDGTATKLQVNIGSKTVTCSSKGTQSVDGYYGSIDCPDPIEFCGTVGKKYCPRNCMNRGKCVNNVCVCREGFSGIDCGLIN